MSWIKTSERQPKNTGQYNVKTNHGNSVAFFTRTFQGRKMWLCVNEDYYVLEWEEKNQKRIMNY